MGSKDSGYNSILRFKNYFDFQPHCELFLLNLWRIIRKSQLVDSDSSDILIKGVIEILSSNHKLGGLKSNEDRIGNSTALMAYDPQGFADCIANRCGAIVLSVGMARQGQ